MSTDNLFLKNIEGDIWTDDPDDSIESRNFYSSYWKDILNRNIGLFRGDTIFSFNTVAGCMIRLLPIYNGKFKMPQSQEDRLDIITNSKDIGDPLKKKFKRFYAIYHTLANFMPLVRLKEYHKRNGSPYLQYVKNDDYHEFPDLFLKDIFLHYEKGKSNYKFLKDNNLKYFNYFGKGIDGWRNFVKQNHLQDFFEDDEFKVFVQLAPSEGVKMPYNILIAKNLSDEEQNECIRQIGIFLTNAIRIIENRALRLENLKQNHIE